MTSINIIQSKRKVAASERIPHKEHWINLTFFTSSPPNKQQFNTEDTHFLCVSHGWLIDSTEEDDYWRNISPQNWDGAENTSPLCVCLLSIFTSRPDEEHEDVKLQCIEEDVDGISSVLTWQWRPPVVWCDNGAEGNVHVAAFHYLGLCEFKKRKEKQWPEGDKKKQVMTWEKDVA